MKTRTAINIISLSICSILFISCSTIGLKSDGVYKLGDKGPAGGFIFYINPDAKKDGWTYLEAAPYDYESFADWGCMDIRTSIEDVGLGSGKKNTDRMLNIRKEKLTAFWAATQCRDGGMSDWFLPSADELNAMFVNLGESIGNKKANIISDLYYWSSSEVYGKNARVVGYSSVHEKVITDHYIWKTEFSCVRPIRAFK